jgi:hypothetical protein
MTLTSANPLISGTDALFLPPKRPHEIRDIYE